MDPDSNSIAQAGLGYTAQGVFLSLDVALEHKENHNCHVGSLQGIGCIVKNTVIVRKHHMVRLLRRMRLVGKTACFAAFDRLSLGLMRLRQVADPAAVYSLVELIDRSQEGLQPCRPCCKDMVERAVKASHKDCEQSLTFQRIAVKEATHPESGREHSRLAVQFLGCRLVVRRRLENNLSLRRLAPRGP
jgi:hypothetical protein